MTFDGVTYDHCRDYIRLNSQLEAVYSLMCDGVWRTIPEITKHIGAASPQSISARLRDFRKEKFGSHIVERKYIGEGLYAYKLVKGGR